METQRIQLTSPTDLPQIGFLLPVSSGSGRNKGSALEVREFFTIGRDPGNHLTLHDPFASGRHARIERKDTGFVLRDTQSRNGTHLNENRIQEANLNIGDRIRFGESVYIFSESKVEVTSLSSRNSAWHNQLQRLPAFAATDFPVLIMGPSGSGKEVLSHWIHEHSPRKRSPFISINCSALGESLIESELFGHMKGSFTGAANDRKGAFESARGGTLFLDEIGDLPLALQPKLLRALENQEIRPVGSDRIIKTDVRILAATHKNLVQNVQMGRFREDLFYRLNVCHIQAPALIEHMEDFEDLLYFFARDLKVRFSFTAIESLRQHTWPGNIRELKNAVSRAHAYFPGRHIQAEDVEHLIDRNPLSLEAAVPGALAQVSKPQSSLIKEIERDMIVQRLVANRGNQRRTAEDLGIAKSTLHDRIKSYEIDIESLLKDL
jgi:DNA-binding NtrC family response regulator